MGDTIKFTAWRLLPIIFILMAAAFWFNDVQQGGPHVFRNLIPLAILVLLSGLALVRGGGHWSGSSTRIRLGLIGYSIPALGLAVYLHYAYSINLNEMFTDAAHPGRIFQFLPIYTTVAGGVGFAIGWIVGRNV